MGSQGSPSLLSKCACGPWRTILTSSLQRSCASRSENSPGRGGSNPGALPPRSCRHSCELSTDGSPPHASGSRNGASATGRRSILGTLPAREPLRRAPPRGAAAPLLGATEPTPRPRSSVYRSERRRGPRRRRRPSAHIGAARDSLAFPLPSSTTCAVLGKAASPPRPSSPRHHPLLLPACVNRPVVGNCPEHLWRRKTKRNHTSTRISLLRHNGSRIVAIGR